MVIHTFEHVSGLRDGTIHIRGNAGNRTGERMRRGLIVIDGDTGDHCGARMIAGSIVIGGVAGRHTGFGMRRGTVLLMQDPRGVAVAFNDAGCYELGILPLIAETVHAVSRRSGLRLRKVRRVRRIVGDLGNRGQGELLIAVE